MIGFLCFYFPAILSVILQGFQRLFIQPWWAIWAISLRDSVAWHDYDFLCHCSDLMKIQLGFRLISLKGSRLLASCKRVVLALFRRLHHFGWRSWPRLRLLHALSQVWPLARPLVLTHALRVWRCVLEWHQRYPLWAIKSPKCWWIQALVLIKFPPNHRDWTHWHSRSRRLSPQL